jgi:hypothetical protein
MRLINSLPLRGRAGERGSNDELFFLIYIPSSCPSPEGRRDPSLTDAVKFY